MGISMVLHSLWKMERSDTDTDRGSEGAHGGDAPVLLRRINLACVVSLLDLTSQEHGMNHQHRVAKSSTLTFQCYNDSRCEG